MNMAYPISFKTYRNGQVGAFFSDVPEAITAGTTEAQALDRAQDALVVALSAYLDQDRLLPKPSKAKRGRRVVLVPPRVAIKLGIHAAMRERSVTQAQCGGSPGHRRAAGPPHSRSRSRVQALSTGIGLGGVGASGVGRDHSHIELTRRGSVGATASRSYSYHRLSS